MQNKYMVVIVTSLEIYETVEDIKKLNEQILKLQEVIKFRTNKSRFK